MKLQRAQAPAPPMPSCEPKPLIGSDFSRQNSDYAPQTIDIQRLTDLLPYLHRYACSLTRNSDEAADLVQDTVERALNKAHLFDGANLRAWLTTICKRIFLNNVRRNKLRGIAVAYDDAPAAALCVQARQDDQMHLSDVKMAMDRLPDHHRFVISLNAVEGLKYNEIAERTNVPVGTVRSRLSRARAQLNSLVDNNSAIHLNE